MPFLVLISLLQAAAFSQPAPQPRSVPAPAVPKEEPLPTERGAQRPQLNLLGQTDTAQGESRRNENVQFNLIDTNTVRELNVRMGTTTTIIPEFRADNGYFGTEYGNRPIPGLHLPPAPRAGQLHGSLSYSHNNSLFSARSFFQVGDVKPARENDYGFQAGFRASKVHSFSFDGRQQKLRGQVNGNVLVPLASERTPLATDPFVRQLITRFLAAFPDELPNRPDIDRRALNTNARQAINTNSAGGRWDMMLNAGNRLGTSYQFTNQQVDAFQFVAGQNPDTDTHSHTARTTFAHTVSPATILSVSGGFERVTTLIRPEPNAVGPTVGFSNFITGLGPPPPIPIVRAQNKFRGGAQVQQNKGNHVWSAGYETIRSQINGREQDTERGIITFNSDAQNDAITNFRLGNSSLYTQALGSTHRGYRAWSHLLFIGDKWKASPRLTLDYGLRYEPFFTPKEVNQIDAVPFPCDCNNIAPRLGIAYSAPRRLGRLRAAWGLHYGELFATTYGQVRMNPPNNFRMAIPTPDLRNPLGGLRADNLPKDLKSGLFLVSPEMSTPYSYQYNFSWEPDFTGQWKLQLGYVGSRTHRLFQMWFENRARPTADPSQTTLGNVNQRRADTSKLEVFRLLNASRAYYDAGRVTLILPRRAGFSGEASYWLSKVIDLGNDYTSTLSGVDARQGRSQSESLVHQDLKARSSFDQKHAFLMRGSYELQVPGRGWMTKAFRGWTLSGVWLLKNGTPFTVESGSDAPGFGNVDGQGSDRVHVIDTSVLGRSIGDPDRSTALLPRSAFAFMKVGDERGNLGRNTFRRGRIANMNSALARTWRLANERALEFRAESINFLNTPQFAEPNRELASPSFGKITNTLNDGRTFRFLLRFRF